MLPRRSRFAVRSVFCICALTIAADHAITSRPRLSAEQVNHVVRSVETACRNADLVALDRLLSPAMHATFVSEDKQSVVLRNLEFRNRLRDLLQAAHSYRVVRRDEHIEIAADLQARATYQAVLEEEVVLEGQRLTNRARETWIIELVDGRPLITAIHSETV